MIHELLTIPVLPRLKVGVRIVSGTHSLRVRYMDWIGLDLVWENGRVFNCGYNTSHPKGKKRSDHPNASSQCWRGRCL